MTVTVSSPTRPTAAWVGWGLVAVWLALFGLGRVLSALTPASLQADRAILGPADLIDLSFLAYVAVGALVVSHRPDNPIGWIFCAIGLAWEIFGCATAYAIYLALVAPASFRAAIPWLVLPENMWRLAFGLAPAVLLYFPNGQLLSGHWRPVVWLFVLSIGVGYVSAASDFNAGPLPVQFPAPLNLLGLRAVDMIVSPINNLANVASLLFYFVGVIAIVLRWRRGRPDERQQLKWLVYGATVLVVVTYVTTQYFDALKQLDPGALHSADLFSGIPYALAVAAIPVAAGIAIMKYRLYDIDLIIRRTLVYGVLTVLLALVYFISVVALQAVFTALTPLGGAQAAGAARSELVTVLSTLAIAVLFVPLRSRLQAAIDRRFYRRKYDAARTLAEFSATLRDEVDLDNLSAHLLAAVDETMQPESVGLWLKSEK